MKKLLPILLALIGTGAGVGAGIFLAPSHDATPAGGEHAAPDAAGDGHGDPHAEPAADGHGEAADDHGGGSDDGHGGGGNEFVKLNSQFVVPVVNGDRIQALVVLSLSLEVVAGGTEIVYAREPKLRDVILRVLFDHANIGGFEGNFTEARRLEILRRSLMEAARNVMGSSVKDVLITEIARQDN